jgi:hypothetical protein
MKLTDSMRYPHPVLSEFSSDYVTGEFRCSFLQQMTAEGELKLTADLALNSRDLQALVDSQKASVGYFVVCRRTYFNVLQQVPLGQSERFFDGSKLFGAVAIRSNFVERIWMTSRRSIASAVLNAMQSDSWITNAEKNFREFMKSLNKLGGGIVFEALARSDIEAFVRDCVTHARRQSSV